jgi:hypothetical protein
MKHTLLSYAHCASLLTQNRGSERHEVNGAALGSATAGRSLWSGPSSRIAVVAPLAPAASISTL